VPAHYLKQFHGDYANAATLAQLADDAGLDDWMQLFRAKADYVNPDSPTMSAWVIVDDSAGAVVYERNPYYWAVDPAGNQLPYIDRIAMTCAESNEGMDFKVLAGEIDFRHGSNFNKYSLFKKAEVKGNFHSIAPKTALIMMIVANQDYEADLEIRDHLRSQDFRIAISLSIDKQEWIDTFYFGQGKLGNVSFMDNSPFYDGVEQYRNLYIIQDKDRANDLLDKIGLTERDADGMRVRLDNGGELEMMGTTPDYVTGGGLQTNEAVEAIYQYPSGVGIRFRVDLADTASWGATLASNMLQFLGPGGLQAGPVPPTPDVHWGPRMLDWAKSGGTEGSAPYTPELARLFQIHVDAGKLPWAERGPLYSEAYRIINEQQYIIGVGAGFPFQNSYTIVKNNMMNVPVDSAGLAIYISRYGNGGFAPARPEQFFFEGGKNDAGF